MQHQNNIGLRWLRDRFSFGQRRSSFGMNNEDRWSPLGDSDIFNGWYWIPSYVLYLRFSPDDLGEFDVSWFNFGKNDFSRHEPANNFIVWILLPVYYAYFKFTHGDKTFFLHRPTTYCRLFLFLAFFITFIAVVYIWSVAKLCIVRQICVTGIEQWLFQF